MIFLIISTTFNSWDNCETCRRFKIYEKIEESGAMKWSYVGNFGLVEYGVLFPPVIQPIRKRKFILFPQEIKQYHKRNMINITSFDQGSAPGRDRDPGHF